MEQAYFWWPARNPKLAAMIFTSSDKLPPASESPNDHEQSSSPSETIAGGNTYSHARRVMSTAQDSARIRSTPRPGDRSSSSFEGVAHGTGATNQWERVPATYGLSSIRARAKSGMSSVRTKVAGGGAALRDKSGYQRRHGISEFLRRTDLNTVSRLKELQALLAGGCDPNQLVRVNWQPFRTSLLFESSINGEHLLVRTLLEAKADPEMLYGPAGFTALYNAALNGHSAVVRLLCEHSAGTSEGASVATLTADGLGPLYAAAQGGHTECVEALLLAKSMARHVAELGLPENLGGHTALHVAAQGGHVECVRLLLSLGKVGIDPRTADQATPLMLALFMAARGVSTKSPAAHRHLQVAQLLLKAGADLHATDARGRSALDYAPSAWREALMLYASGGLGGGEDGLLASVLGAGTPARIDSATSSPADGRRARFEGDAAGDDAGSGGFLGDVGLAFRKCCRCAPCRRLC